jgi:hypothetical protein
MGFLVALVLATITLTGLGHGFVQPQLVWSRPSPASGVSVGTTGVFVVGGGAVTRYDFDGKLVWTRQTSAYGIALGRTAAYVVGHVGSNASVERYTLAGDLVWAIQFDGGADPLRLGRAWASAVAVDSTAVYVTGTTEEFNQYPVYSFVAKFDPNGTELWTQKIGHVATSISVGAKGVYVSWISACVPHDCQPIYEDFVSAIDFTGNTMWTREIGTTCSSVIYYCEYKPDDFVYGVAAGPTGIYVAGATRGNFPGQVQHHPSRFGTDAFLRKYDLSGNEVWTRQFGSYSSDNNYANGLSMGPGGLYVVGSTGNSFVGLFDSNGNQVWKLQFGAQSPDFVSVSASTRGVFLGSSDYIAKVCASRLCIHE